MAPVPGNAFLNRVIVRVHAATHSCLNQEAFELGAITLRLLSLLRCGQPADLDVATAAAFGCRFSKWQERNLERQSALAWEFSKLIPDYDASASVSHHRNENVQPTVSIRTAKERHRASARDAIAKETHAARIFAAGVWKSSENG